MIPVYQTSLRPPLGNCMQACVASLFEEDLDTVPPFVEWQGPLAWWDEIRRFVRSWGPIDIGCIDNIKAYLEVDWSNTDPAWRYAIASVPSVNGPWNHAVIVDDHNLVVHDPYPGSDVWTGKQAEAKEWWVLVDEQYTWPTPVGEFS